MKSTLCTVSPRRVRATSQRGTRSWRAARESFRMAVNNLTPSSTFVVDPLVKALMSLTNPVFDPSNPDVFFQVFGRFGTHVVTQMAVGGRVDYSATVSKTAAADSQTVGAKMGLEYQAVFGSVGAQAQADWNKLTASWSSERHSSINSIGGSSALMALADPSFGDNYGVTFSSWLLTLDAQPGVVGLELQPLSALSLFSGQMAGAVDDAIATRGGSPQAPTRVPRPGRGPTPGVPGTRPRRRPRCGPRSNSAVAATTAATVWLRLCMSAASTIISFALPCCSSWTARQTAGGHGLLRALPRSYQVTPNHPDRRTSDKAKGGQTQVDSLKESQLAAGRDPLQRVGRHRRTNRNSKPRSGSAPSGGWAPRTAR